MLFRSQGSTSGFVHYDSRHISVEGLPFHTSKGVSVMSVKPEETLRKDTRGLPEGYDPHMFYEYKISTLSQTATGIESFAYKYIPWKYLRSFAFAIDPTGPFKVAPYAITPENRTRVRQTDSVLLKRTFRRKIFNWGYSQVPNYNNQSVCWSPNPQSYNQFVSESSGSVSDQLPLPDEAKDTTSRTRLLGSNQGTMRFFKSYINSPGRTVSKIDTTRQIQDFGPTSPSCSAVGGVTLVDRTGYDTDTWTVMPTAAVFAPSDLITLRTQEYAYLESLISQQAVSMLKDWSPSRRSSTLFRNIVELRDIPRSIASLRATLGDLRSLQTSLGRLKLDKIVFDLKKTSKHIPDEYLSYHFGWKQTYKDLMELLKLPEAMSKKYEFLIRRAGKPTTFRVKRDFTSALSASVPNFDYNTAPFPNEYDILTKSRIERVTQVRLVINATFDFPTPNSVSFRTKDYLDRVGLIPRPTDLYNLTPWTWLLDWFTGLGSYVELIDNMARDDSLINWGFFTAKTSGRLITNRQSKTDNVSRLSIFPNPTITTTSTVVNNHESVLNYECQIRKDAATALSVKTIAGMNLSPYQLSILGALLAQRKAMFIPHS